MRSEFYIFLIISVFPSISSRRIKKEVLPGFGEYDGTILLKEPFSFDWDLLDDELYHFTFRLRLPHWIGHRFRRQKMVIRTFPTEINYFKENTEYTKNISLEMESSCGSSKSAFDETDIVTLTLMERLYNSSVPVKTIKIDPLSVDFYSPKLSMKQFKMLADYEIQRRNETCNRLCKLFQGYTFIDKALMLCPNSCATCPTKVEDYSQSLAEMEKFVKIRKYLYLFHYGSPSCKIEYYFGHEGVLELDKETVSSFPELKYNHYFIASVTDTKSQKNATIVIKNYKII